MPFYKNPRLHQKKIIKSVIRIQIDKTGTVGGKVIYTQKSTATQHAATFRVTDTCLLKGNKKKNYFENPVTMTIATKATAGQQVSCCILS